MKRFYKSLVKFMKSTPNRSFIVFPIIVVGWEYALQRGSLAVNPYYFVLMLWGYGQYRLCGRYRIGIGGGGPGINNPPERIVTSGIYRYTRNPMYLGHIIFLLGLTLTLQSALAALITAATAFWFHRRVLSDEQRLRKLFGAAYESYLAHTKRWIPGLI